MFEWLKTGKTTQPRTGMPSPQLDEGEFKRRFLAQFVDPGFETLTAELARVSQAAWDVYINSRKAPRTRKAGAGYADPDYELALDWIAASTAVQDAAARYQDAALPNRILLINGSSRSEHTCPGEMSKTFRLAEIARAVFTEYKATVDFLDLSRLASEYGRRIHPCKACFSTAPALCHWPCSRYPNYALGQTQDWMNEIYPLWVAAHGIMIVTPVNWYQPSSPLRLVCADGGNPDPTRTHGKNAQKAKEIELAGWNYPRHLAGRFFAVVAHGDAEGVQNAAHTLYDWLSSMHLEPAGHGAELDRYIGYWKPYATSHAELDADTGIQEEVRFVARTLIETVKAKRSGKLTAVPEVVAPREK
jgi:multimeric flavodoxin WrbA